MQLKSTSCVSTMLKQHCGVSWVSAVFFQSIFMKFQTVSLQFQNKGLTQVVQLSTSQTWLIKTFLDYKKTSEKHNSIEA